MVVLLEKLTLDQSKTFSLVLSASQIHHRTNLGEDGYVLFVEEDHYDEAMKAITAYLNENRERLRDQATRPRSFMKTYSAAVVAGVLVCIHIVVSNRWEFRDVMQTYGASALHICRGELYRTVTALMLHSGPMHITTNLIGLTVFGTALCGIAGFGIGWLLILLSGILGNLLNAWFYETAHLAIGASTALFGAVGLVSLEQVLWKLKTGGAKARAWLPLGGGLALLAFMGASQQTDLMGHLFGFLAGCALSVIYTSFVSTAMSLFYQIVGAILTIGIIVVAWLTPLL